MFIRLKRPTFVLQRNVARPLPEEVLFNLSRIGAVSFGKTSTEINVYPDGQPAFRVPAREANTIQIDTDGHLDELLERSFVERRTVLVFPQQMHGEYERIKRIIEAHVEES